MDLYPLRTQHREEDDTHYGKIGCLWFNADQTLSFSLTVEGWNVSLERADESFTRTYPDMPLQSDVIESFGGIIMGDFDPAARGISSNPEMSAFVPMLRIRIS